MKNYYWLTLWCQYSYYQELHGIQSWYSLEIMRSAGQNHAAPVTAHPFKHNWPLLSTQMSVYFLIDRACMDEMRWGSKTHLWPDLRKAGFHAHNSKTHFSPSNNGCTRWLTIQPGIDAESSPGCFCCGLFLRFVSEACQMSTSVRVAFKRLHIPWQADSWL